MRVILMLMLLAAVAACDTAERYKVAEVKAVRADAPYADRLAVCARSSRQRSCRLRDLPPLGLEHATIGVDDVMQRVAVSHPWMGRRFEALLRSLPEDMLTLMGPVTAIVIASDVRPSFYWRFTGAIYLDPDLLWLTVDEKRSIDPAPDYRSGFGLQLSHRFFARYVRDGGYAWRAYSLTDDEEREFDAIVEPAARLLYHELAHANDFLPPASWSQLPPELTMVAAAARVERQGEQLSQRLVAAYPLTDATMFALAQVNFAGFEASPDLLALRPEEAVAHFEPDGANDDYAYFTRYEDLAQLFEETMVRLHFGAARDIAVVRIPEQDAPAANDYVVVWGQRGRIAEAQVRPRARLIVDALLPAAAQALDGLPAAQSLPAETGWIDALGGTAKARVIGLDERRAADDLRY